MNSIRPLVTITLLGIAAVFLYTKINEGPAHVANVASEAFSGPSATQGTFPLAATSPEVATPPAPAWGESATPSAPPTPQWAGSVDDATNPATATGVPPIPELPPLAEATPVEPATPMPPATPLPTATIDPPAHVPVARYSTDAPDEDAAPAPTASPFPMAATPSPASQTPAAAGPEPASAEADRYAMPVQQSPVASAPEAPSSSPLAKSWPAIEAALQRQELAQAHQMLSQWYDSPALSPTEAQQVETLLSQLAGSVVYSTEHRLEPPYVVHQGETLQTIAEKYEVPWQLLAKINGIPAANMVQPGQELKVVHGPFSAVVELSKSQMTLMLGDRYAGRFPIVTEPAAAQSEGQWTLEQKLANPAADASGVMNASFSASTAPVDRTLVLRSDSPQAAGATISITSGPTTPTGPTAVAPAVIRLSPQDAEELADILSIGSRVTIRR